jgi:hypothetical protein
MIYQFIDWNCAQAASFVPRYMSHLRHNSTYSIPAPSMKGKKPFELRLEIYFASALVHFQEGITTGAETPFYDMETTGFVFT